MKDNSLRFYIKMQSLRSQILSEEAQDLIEYALVVAMIAFAAVAGMGTVATKINAAFTNIGTKLNTYTT